MNSSKKVTTMLARIDTDPGEDADDAAVLQQQVLAAQPRTARAPGGRRTC
jgi:hypothetical protein